MPLDAAGSVPDDPFERANANSSIMFPVAERKVGWETREKSFAIAPSHKAIIRTTPDGAGVLVLNIVGSNYKLIHNRELFGHVEDTLRKKMQPEMLEDVRITDKVSGWGRVCLREYVFPRLRCVLRRGAKSVIGFRLIVQNGYGGSALRLHAGAIEFYCMNGMIIGDYQSAYNKHTSGLVVSGIGDSVEQALHVFVDNQVKWQRWVNTPVRHEKAMELFKELASSDKLRENLGQQYLREREDRGDNLWAVYSALTFYASHAEGEFKLRDSVKAQDTEASTMLQRELTVAKWLNTPTWKKLEVA
jgi:hypothetical protein